MELKEIELKDMSKSEVDISIPNSPLNDNENVDPTDFKDTRPEPPKSPKEIESKSTMTATDFAINMMKGIAGTGSLAIPLAMKNVGIIPAIGLFMIVSLLYIYSSYQLITLQKHFCGKQHTGIGIIQTNNDFARLCYLALGKAGYYLFNFALLVTLYGACIGTMVVCTDFLNCLPFLNNSPFLKKLISQILLAVVAILFCMLKDPSLYVGISSFGLIALVISFLLLFFYSITHFKFSFSTSYLWPVSTTSFLNSLGIFMYSLAFSLFLLSQVKHVRESHRKKIVSTITVSVAAMACIYAAIGIIFFTLLETSEQGVKGNILLSLPAGHWTSVTISLLMVFTCIGAYPLYMDSIHEVVERNYGTLKTNKWFILNRDCWIFRGSEIALISIIAFVMPSFSDILSFNILF